mmetsp:Transcript_25604/g.33509  ORF Transcript_25604/g.33509 Transcript_25604/m.33509 type:complete len:546 (+) Transcript_25604:71-1708(+)
MDPAIVSSEDQRKLLYAAYEEAQRARQQQVRAARLLLALLIFLLCCYAQLEANAGRLQGFCSYSNTVWGVAAFALMVVGTTAHSLWISKALKTISPEEARLTDRQRQLLGLPPKPGLSSQKQRKQPSKAPKKQGKEDAPSLRTPKQQADARNTASSLGKSPFARNVGLSKDIQRQLSGRKSHPTTPLFSSPLNRYGGTPGGSRQEAESILDQHQERQSTLKEGLDLSSTSHGDSVVGRLGLNRSKSPYGTSNISPIGVGMSPQTPIYQVAQRQEVVVSSPFSQEGLPLTERDLAAARALPSKLGLQAEFDDSADNVRRFLGKIARHVVSDLVWVERELEMRGVSIESLQFDFHRITNPIDDVRFKAIHPRTKIEVNLLQEFKDLEKVFHVWGDHKYVVERLQTLAGDLHLGNFKWNSGGSYKGKPWSAEFPPDAAVVMHLLLWYGDSLLRETGTPFSRMHYLESLPKKASSLRGKYMIMKHSLHPPHYKVVANGEIWEILPGRHNLFHAIELFLYSIKMQKSGFLSNVDLNHVLGEVLHGSLSSF